MNRFIYIIFLILIAPAFTAVAEQKVDEGQVVIKTEKKSVFKGLLYKMWGKLRALSPRKVKKKSRTIATAGVRGAETTESLINPYWKDDKTDDPDYIKELTQYTKAQQMAEDGNLQGAVKALSAFIDGYGDSDLKPNAQFALAISYGALGQKQQSIDTFQTFVNDNPRHPLVADAKRVIAEL